MHMAQFIVDEKLSDVVATNLLILLQNPHVCRLKEGGVDEGPSNFVCCFEASWHFARLLN
jgi:hypothetical protein